MGHKKFSKGCISPGWYCQSTGWLCLISGCYEYSQRWRHLERFGWLEARDVQVMLQLKGAGLHVPLVPSQYCRGCSWRTFEAFCSQRERLKETLGNRVLGTCEFDFK